MAADRRDRVLADLLDLFAQEREALCAGNLDQAALLGERKLALIDSIGDDLPDQARLMPLREAARRNARLLAAALAGLHEGAGHLQVIRLGAEGFSSYDRGGRPDRIAGMTPRRFERRA